ncbi:MAG: metallophosphoesterase [Actinomycetota bacterium]
MIAAIVFSVLGAGVAALLYASVVERNWFALRTHRVPCLPAGSPPLRILHLSDLHYRRSLRMMRRFVTGLARVKPDLIVGTGDFLGEQGAAGECAALMTSIPARFGGVYVLGSNDYYAPVLKSPFVYFKKHRSHEVVAGSPRNEWQELVATLDKSGWQFLQNRSISLDGIDIVGLDDPHIYRHDLSVVEARSGDGFRLAVVHSPDGAKPLADLGYDLILAGHTHGGQIRVPIYGALVTNTRTLPRAMARGLHRLDGAWLHVSAGLGTSKYAPARFFCRPEACVLELVERGTMA